MNFACYSPSKVSINQGQASITPSTISNSNNQMKATPSRLHTEQIQVVQQMPLQPNQWGTKGTPFYKKASFQHRPHQQHSKVNNQQGRKSFQKYILPDNSSKHHSVDPNSEKSASMMAGECAPADGSVKSDMQIQCNLREIWKQARSTQMARIKAKKVGVILKHIHQVWYISI